MAKQRKSGVAAQAAALIVCVPGANNRALPGIYEILSCLAGQPTPIFTQTQS